jgi:GTP-binding protein
MNYNKAEFTASYGLFKQIPPSDRPEFAFAGHSNVGKSSLINKLFNRKNLARVSSVPGKTVTINFYKGDGVSFVDLPGYGYAKRNESEKKRWAELMEGYFASGRSIALVIVLIDMRHPPTADDMTMLAFLRDSGFKFTIALTKCDKLNKGELNSRRENLKTELADYSDIEKTEFSSVTGEGVDSLKRIIEASV